MDEAWAAAMVGRLGTLKAKPFETLPRANRSPAQPV